MAPDLRVIRGGASDEADAAPDPEAVEGPSSDDARPLTAEQQALVAMGTSLLPKCAEVVARSFHYLGVTPEELLAPGAIGLREAALAYDSERPTSFLTYARCHVRGRMVEAVRAEHFSLRARMERAMDRSLDLFASDQVTGPTASDDPDVAAAEGWRRACDEALSASALAGLQAMAQESPEEVAVARISLRQGMSALTPPEREVIRLWYEEGLTLEEIAEKTGVHWNTAQRRHASALRKLRGFLLG
jgi:RNA polymerase sigma factor (sigma-70 family)